MQNLLVCLLKVFLSAARFGKYDCLAHNPLRFHFGKARFQGGEKGFPLSVLLIELASPPPIETEGGWLLIYHGVCETIIGKTYHATAALLDLNQPEKVIARLKQPLFSPTEKWELEGVVNHVVFPTGSAQFDEFLYIYYGAADTHTAVARVNMPALLNELKNQN